MINAIIGIFLLTNIANAACTADSLAVTHGSSGSYVYGEGAGCIRRPIQDVWSALKTPQAMTFDGSTLTSSDLRNPPAGVLYTYENQYEAGGIFSVSWTMDWHHMLKSGTVAQPATVQIHYVKISGTSYISLWEGDITLQSVSPTSTAITLRNQINAAQTDENDAASTVQQLFDKLK